jgi:hypothetical protein
MKRSNLGHNSYRIQTKFNNVGCETNRYFRDKKRENLRGKDNKCQTSRTRLLETYMRYSEWSETRKSFTATAFCLCFTAYNVQDQEGFQVNGTHQLLVYTHVNLSYTNITTRKKNAKALLVDMQDTGLQINAKKIGLNIIQSKYHNIKIANKSLKTYGIETSKLHAHY